MNARHPTYRPLWTGWALLACLGVGSVAIARGETLAGGLVMGLALVGIAIWLAVDVLGGRP